MKFEKERSAIKSFRLADKSKLKDLGWKEIFPWVFIHVEFPDIKIDWAPGKRIRATSPDNLKGVFEI